MAYSLKYSFNSSTSSYSVTGYENITSSDIVVIPDTYNDGTNGEHPVIRIDNSAFSNCTSLTSVTIGNNVTTIDSQAFFRCSSLTSITIPDSVTIIGSSVFTFCDSLTSITIGNGVTSIGVNAFYNTAYYNNENNWEDSVLYIGKYVIGAKNTLSGSYTIKDETLTIANSAFIGCSSLTSITIPDSVTSIGDYAFRGCSSLTSIIIPDSVTIIGGSVFYGCSSLTSASIPDSVTSIGSSTFYNCSSLTNVTMGNGVTSISSSAFEGCSSLTSITIPDSVTSIGSSAFKGCSSLTNVMIPNSVTSIGSSTFWFCSSLTSIIIPDSVTSIGDFTFYNCISLTSVTIGNSVTSIGNREFSSCSSLTSITIPDSVTSIGSSAFSGCDNLKQLLLFPSIPPTLGSSAIPNTISSIYVQQLSIEAYTSTTNWNSYADKIVSNDLYLSFASFNQKNKKYIDDGLNKKLSVLDDGRVKVQAAPTESNDVVRKQELDKKLDKPTNPITPSFVTINDVGFVDTKKVSDFLQTKGGNVTGNIYSTGEFTANRFTADEWLAVEGSYADKSAFIATALVSSVQGSPDYSYFTIVVDDTSKLFVNKVVALCNDKGLIYGGLSAIRIASIDTNTKTVRFNVPEIDGDTFWGTTIGLYSSTIDETLYKYDRISNDNNYLEFPNSSGTIALTPNAAPSEPSFIITAADRTPTWQSVAPILQDYVDDALLGG